MPGKSILLVDDEEDILELLEYNLAREGYRVMRAMSGEEALELSKARQPDLIVLDLMLPGLSGLDVCRLLKSHPRTSGIPVVMLTARGEEADVVLGLEVGAEDYVTKPFSPRVLNARMRAVLRRGKVVTEDREQPINVHEIEIVPGRHEVLVAGRRIPMTLTEFKILYFLARRPGWVFTRSQIVEAVRGEDNVVTDRAVDVQIVGIRKKLGKQAANIETVRGVGYRFRE